MRILLSVLMLGLTAFLYSAADAQEKKEGKGGKEVTLKGKITCAKCDLGTATECETVLVVTKDKKDTVYFFDAAGHKKNHGAICSAGKNGTVVGTIGEAGKKKTITVKSVKFE